jgi:hypothetical protein
VFVTDSLVNEGLRTELEVLWLTIDDELHVADPSTTRDTLPPLNAPFLLISWNKIFFLRQVPEAGKMPCSMRNVRSDDVWTVG